MIEEYACHNGRPTDSRGHLRPGRLVARDGRRPLPGDTHRLLAQRPTETTVAGGERVWRRYPPPYRQPDAELAGWQLGQPVALAGSRLVLQGGDGADWTVLLADADRSTTVDLGKGCAMVANAAAIIVRRPCGPGAAVWVRNLRSQTAWVSLPVSYRRGDHRLSPDGQLVAIALGSEPHPELQVFDTATGQVVATDGPDAFQWTLTRHSRYVIVVTCVARQGPIYRYGWATIARAASRAAPNSASGYVHAGPSSRENSVIIVWPSWRKTSAGMSNLPAR